MQQKIKEKFPNANIELKAGTAGDGEYEITVDGFLIFSKVRACCVVIIVSLSFGLQLKEGSFPDDDVLVKALVDYKTSGKVLFFSLCVCCLHFVLMRVCGVVVQLEKVGPRQESCLIM